MRVGNARYLFSIVFKIDNLYNESTKFIPIPDGHCADLQARRMRPLTVDEYSFSLLQMNLNTFSHDRKHLSFAQKTEPTQLSYWV
jgi:hypothetical protein